MDEGSPGRYQAVNRNRNVMDNVSIHNKQLTDYARMKHCNTEYRNKRRINVHAHLPIVFDCRDVIKICGQL